LVSWGSPLGGLALSSIKTPTGGQWFVLILSGRPLFALQIAAIEFSLAISTRIEKVDIDQIRREVAPFVKDPTALAIWSKEFFLDVASRIKIV